HRPVQVGGHDALPEVVVEIIPGRTLEGPGVVDQDVDVAQLIGDPVAGGFDRRRIADVEPHRNRLVARVGDEGDRLTGVAAVPENDACAALGEAHGYGLADAPGGSGHQRYPPGVGVRGVVRWHVTCPFWDGGAIGAYEARRVEADVASRSGPCLAAICVRTSSPPGPKISCCP